MSEGMPDDGLDIASYDENTMINQGTSALPLPQLTFHRVHGTNITLLCNGRIAKRAESFCKGLAFSSRPIQIDENVCIRFSEVVSNWSGVLRFGVTNVDPETFRNVELPKFACPDLTSKDGFWAKALPERYSVEGSILHFFVNADGEMYYGINGVLKGLFLTGINVSSPIWIIVDIYGNSSALEFIDPNEVRIRSAARKSRQNSVSALKSQLLANNSNTQYRANRSTPGLPTSKYHAGVQFNTFSFHSVHGPNITLSNNYTVAERHTGEYACGYVFTSRPVNFNEKVVIQVLETENAYSGSLAFGVTSCDPIKIRTSSLPLDSDELLNRPEYWVGIKDVAAQPKVSDELSFWITDKGEVYFAKNNLTPRVIIYVDTAVKLWAFFDVYGTTQKIRLLGTVKIGTSALVSHRLPPLQNTSRSTKSLIDLSPDSAPSSSHSINLDNSNTQQQLSNRALINTPSQVLLGRRSHSETGELLNAQHRHPSSLLINAEPGWGVVRPGSRPVPIDGVESTWSFVGPGPSVIPMDGNSLLEALENNTTSRLFSDLASRVTAGSRPLVRSPCPPPVPARKSPARAPPSNMLNRRKNVADSGNLASNTDDLDEREECKICMSAKVDCVIYTCGHMSMCFSCANEAWRVKGECPICRKRITDVIKIYKS